jgi:A/G-specific adenine glycosylase
MTPGGVNKAAPKRAANPAARDSAIAKTLLKWYRKNRRDLPWRRTRDPYRIWVSEVMLQQTRVAAVIPYYQRFLDRFPTVAALAAAPEQHLLAAWSGLGYYRRARQLQSAARTVVGEHAGEIPQSLAALRSLSGIGDYTAAAISSIAFGAQHAVLDGNVMRVLTRLDDDPSDIATPATRKALQARAQQLIEAAPLKNPGDFNQAIMEFGATLCAPRQPNCAACPLTSHCKAYNSQTQTQRPIKSRKEKSERLEIAVAIVRQDGKLLLRQRPKTSTIMPGFWELPQVQGPRLRNDCFAEIGIQTAQKAGEFRHGITFRSFRGKVYIASLIGARPKGYRWISERKRLGLPLTTVTQKALAAAEVAAHQR